MRNARAFKRIVFSAGARTAAHAHSDRRDAPGVNTASVEDTVDFFDKFIAERAKFFEADCHVLIENQARSFGVAAAAAA